MDVGGRAAFAHCSLCIGFPSRIAIFSLYFHKMHLLYSCKLFIRFNVASRVPIFPPQYKVSTQMIVASCAQMQKNDFIKRQIFLKRKPFVQITHIQSKVSPCPQSRRREQKFMLNPHLGSKFKEEVWNENRNEELTMKEEQRWWSKLT